MIRIVLIVGSTDELIGIEARGHANCGTLGNDPVCAAVSFLLRTVALYLGDACTAQAESRGAFSLNVNKGFVGKNQDDKTEKLLRLRFISSFIQTGINSLVKEYPDSVELSIKNSKE